MLYFIALFALYVANAVLAWNLPLWILITAALPAIFILIFMVLVFFGLIAAATPSNVRMRRIK